MFHFAASHRIGHQHLLFRQVGHAKLLTPPLLPQIIESSIYRQAIQPRFKDLRRPQLIERKIKPQENFLCDILDIFRTRDQPGDRTQNPLSVRQYDFVKRDTIAILRAFYELEINQHAAPAVPASEYSNDSEWIGVPASRQVTKLYGETQKAFAAHGPFGPRGYQLSAFSGQLASAGIGLPSHG
jgi:hypothetical protein